MAIGLGASERSLYVQAARDYFDADDPARARELLEAVIADAGPGVQRAEALGLLGTIVYAVEDYGRAVATLKGAFAEAGGDYAVAVFDRDGVVYGVAEHGPGCLGTPIRGYRRAGGREGR